MAQSDYEKILSYPTKQDFKIDFVSTDAAPAEATKTVEVVAPVEAPKPAEVAPVEVVTPPETTTETPPAV